MSYMKQSKTLKSTQYRLEIMHLSVAIPGGDPRDIRGIAQDLPTFVANFWPGTGVLNCFCTSEAKYTGKKLRDL